MTTRKFYKTPLVGALLVVTSNENILWPKIIGNADFVTNLHPKVVGTMISIKSRPLHFSRQR